jgi:hypothetical protein
MTSRANPELRKGSGVVFGAARNPGGTRGAAATAWSGAGSPGLAAFIDITADAAKRTRTGAMRARRESAALILMRSSLAFKRSAVVQKYSLYRNPVKDLIGGLSP